MLLFVYDGSNEKYSCICCPFCFSTMVYISNWYIGFCLFSNICISNFSEQLCCLSHCGFCFLNVRLKSNHALSIAQLIWMKGTKALLRYCMHTASWTWNVCMEHKYRFILATRSTVYACNYCYVLKQSVGKQISLKPGTQWSKVSWFTRDLPNFDCCVALSVRKKHIVRSASVNQTQWKTFFDQPLAVLIYIFCQYNVPARLRFLHLPCLCWCRNLFVSLFGLLAELITIGHVHPGI